MIQVTTSRPGRIALPGPLVALLMLAACGGGRPASDAEEPPAPAAAPPAGTAPFDACRFITKAEAESALGMELDDPKSGAYNPVANDAECTFDTAGDGQLRALSIRVTALQNQAAGVERLRELLGPDVETRAGLGDHALVAAGQLFVFKGRRQVTIIVAPQMGQGMNREEARDAVAKTVLARLDE
jgi:hypothetical protein